MLQTLLILTLLSLGACGKEQIPGPPGPKGDTGEQGAPGADGTNGVNGVSGVVAVIDPCGDDPGHHDEIILRLSPTVLIAYFKSGGYEMLTQLQLGAGYTTTDHQACNITVELNGTVTDTNGGIY